MIIKKIHINNFGKLSNYDIDFDDSFTVVYGNNEDGKSTVMAFIQMILYGYTGRIKDISKNPRKKYKPWDGSTMGGYIEFNDEGVNYRLSRTFGKTNASDDINVMNLDTGELEKLGSKEDPGKRFFDLGAEAFEKSVFIGQSGSVIDTNGKEDEITQRLLNLVTTGDEKTSYKKVDGIITSAMEKLKSRSGKIGILDKEMEKFQSLQTNKVTAEVDEEDKRRSVFKIQDLKNQISTIKKEYGRKRRLLEIQDKLEKIDEINSTINLKQRVENLRTDYTDLADTLKREDGILNQIFLDDGQKLIQQVENNLGILNERKNSLKTEQEKYQSQKKLEYKEIPDGHYNELKEKERAFQLLNNEYEDDQDKKKLLRKYLDSKKDYTESEAKLLDLRDKLRDAQKNVHEITDLLNNADDAFKSSKKAWEYAKEKEDILTQKLNQASNKYQLSKQQAENVRNTWDERVSNAKEKLQEVSVSRNVSMEKKGTKTINKPLAAVGVAVIILSIILGITMVPILFAGVFLGGILLILSIKKSGNETVTTTIVDNEAVTLNQEKLEEIMKSAEKSIREARDKEKRDKDLANEALATLNNFIENCKNLSNKMNEDEAQKQKGGEKLAEANNLVSALRAKIETEEGNLEKDKNKLLGYGIEGSEEDFKELAEGLHKKQKEVDLLKAEITNKLSEVNCSNIDELSEKWNEYRNHKASLEAKEKDMLKKDEEVQESKKLYDSITSKLISHVSKYQIVSNYNEAEDKLKELNKKLRELESSRIGLQTSEEQLEDVVKNTTIEEFGKNLNTLEDEVKAVSDGELLKILNPMELVELKEDTEEIRKKEKEISTEIVQLETEMKQKYKDKKNVSQIENELKEISEVIQERETYYDSLNEAKETLNEAFKEVQQSFGPMLNDRTSQIFGNLTGGRYNKVKVTRDLEINIEDCSDKNFHEWKYLSSGTIDQAYLSLRLAVSELISKEKRRLPIMLDDVFTQYDDTRAKQGLEFIEEYQSKTKVATQVIFFTCHKRMVDWAINDFKEIKVKMLNAEEV